MSFPLTELSSWKRLKRHREPLAGSTLQTFFTFHDHLVMLARRTMKELNADRSADGYDSFTGFLLNLYYRHHKQRPPPVNSRM
jgi:hypothetical protein